MQEILSETEIHDKCVNFVTFFSEEISKSQILRTEEHSEGKATMSLSMLLEVGNCDGHFSFDSYFEVTLKGQMRGLHCMYM